MQPLKVEGEKRNELLAAVPKVWEIEKKKERELFTTLVKKRRKRITTLKPVIPREEQEVGGEKEHEIPRMRVCRRRRKKEWNCFGKMFV